MREMSERFILKNKKTIAKGIQDFLDNTRNYDYESFVKTKELVIRDVNQAAKFAYEHLGKEVYEQFMDKALPFESYFYQDSGKEKEELKERISKVALGVKHKTANLIDIIDVGCRNLYQYIAMVRQLSYKYKMLPATAYIENAEYLRVVGNYNEDVVNGTTEIQGFDEAAILEVLKSRGLKDNGITRRAAFYYLKRTNQNKPAR